VVYRSAAQVIKQSRHLALPSLGLSKAHLRWDRRRASASSKSSSKSPPDAKSSPQPLQSRQTLPTLDVKLEDHTHKMRAPPLPSRQQQQQQQPFQNMNGYPNISPFIALLPTESQIRLGSAFNPNDPMTVMLVAGSEHLPQPYNYNFSSSLSKPRSFHQPFDGVSATVAPSALDISPHNQNYSQPPATMSMASSPSPALHLELVESMPDISQGSHVHER